MTDVLHLSISCQGRAWRFVPALAQRHHTGVEVGDFSDPDLLPSWRERWREIRSLLAEIPGEITMHGPRSEMNPGLRDREMVDLCRRRYRLALDIAAEIEAGAVVFHSGFNPLIRAPGFTGRWIRRSADFWRELAQEAGRLGVQILLENVWEPQPEVLGDLVDAVGSPFVRVCFDVGHANAYSRERLQDWFSTLGDRVDYVHLHNNDGRLDSHRPLEEGTIDFAGFLPLLAIAPQPPRLVLEISGGRREVEDSLFYLRRLLGLES